MTYTVQREDLAQLKGEWVDLLARQAEPVPFQHPAWQRVWLDEFQDGHELLLLSIRDGDELVGVAPLLRDADTLTMVGHYSICDYMDFVIAEDQCRDVFAALLDHLADADWSKMDLRGIREGSSTLTELSALAEGRNMRVEQGEEAVAPRVELEPRRVVVGHMVATRAVVILDLVNQDPHGLHIAFDEQTFADKFAEVVL